MKVSVVIPAYNCTHCLQRTVQSVQAQTFQDWEAIIVDDCSTDDTYAIAQQLAAEDPRIRVLHNPVNSGVSVTRNRAIAEAKGAYIALLDGDDLWTPDKLERQVALLEQGYDLVYCSYDFVDENWNPIRHRKPFIVPEETNFRKMLVSSVISSSTALARRELLQAHPYRADVYHEDYTLWMELLSQPIRVAGDKNVLMHYRQSTGSRSNGKLKAAKERWETYRSVLKLGLFTSVWAFVCYSFLGVKKYFL